MASPYESDDEIIKDMATSIKAVEQILNYKFKSEKFLEEALTHSSCTDLPSYQRLEFMGDAALGLAVSNYVYLAYPELEPGQFSLLRAANISTEKLARVAIHHGFISMFATIQLPLMERYIMRIFLLHCILCFKKS